MTTSMENESTSTQNKPGAKPSLITTYDEDTEDQDNDAVNHFSLKREQEQNNIDNDDRNSKLKSFEDLIVVPSSAGIPHIFENSFTKHNSTTQPSVRSNLQKIRFPSLDRIAPTIPSNKHNSRSSTSTFSSNRSTMSSITRFDVDEIIFSLREKARHNFRELRHNFIINDPMGVGNVRREALGRVLTRLLYWPVKQKHVTQLLSQLGIPRDKELINFTEFYATLYPRNKEFNSLSSKKENKEIHGLPNSERQLVPLQQTNQNKDNTEDDKNNNNNNAFRLLTDSDESTDLANSTESNRDWSFLTELPSQSDPVRPNLLAHQAMAILRQHLFKGSLQLDNLFKLNTHDGQNQLIDRNEFYQKLSQLGLCMSNGEFMKFWKRLNPKNESSLPAEYFLQHMNLSSNHNNGQASNNMLLAITDGEMTSLNQSKLSPIQSIIPSLIRRFRKGYRKACKAVEICTKRYIKDLAENPNSLHNDITPMPEGYTNADIFIEVLKYLKLPVLEKIQLGKFFSRYGLTLTSRGLLPYAELFRRFQDRSEAGVVHQLLTYTLISKKPYNEQDENIIKLEYELTRKFHRDFLTLLNTLRNFDPDRSGTITPANFRIILFNHYGFEFSDESFKEFLDYLPLDSSGNVQYAEFMRQFDSRGVKYEPLLVEKSREDHQAGNCKLESSVMLENKKDAQSTDQIKSESIDQSQTTINVKTHHRTMKDLKKIIHETLKSKVHEIESRFYELDEYNTGRLTQEQLYQLLRIANIEPEITRGEIRKLWPEFFVDRKQCLSFHEFLRHFLYRKSDASYPNAKLVPPRLGDADLMPCSNKLNGVTCLIKDSLRAKIDFMFDLLYKEFVEMDPEGTGFITHSQLAQVLIELCLQVSDRELDDLIEKFDIHKTEREISYLALLQPFIRNRLLKSNKLDRKSISLLANQILGTAKTNQITSSLLPILNEVKPKVPISRLGWSKIRRSMQQADKTRCGRLEAPVFRDLYQNGTGIRLTDEQVYQLLTRLDPDVSGTLPYVRLLEDTQAICNYEDEVSRTKMSKGENTEEQCDKTTNNEEHTQES
ncbi:unnamed protein product [Heterobilharzia americana]|nr:unnamed protein product [Heterobilharzia americana]